MSSNSSNSSSEIVPGSSKGEGNTITSPSPKKPQISPAKFWCFTLNNYTDKDISDCSSKFSLVCKSCIFSKEIGESGTPHLQGFCEFKVKCRPISHGLTERISWRKCKGDKEQNIDYCSKGEQPKEEWESLGKAGPNYGLNVDIAFSIGIPKPIVRVTSNLLRRDQLDIANIFLEDEHPLYGRKIYWFWESKGGWGKSMLATYMIDQMRATEVSGKGADVLCGISKLIEENGECPPIVIYDIPRSVCDYVSYMSIEKLKDGKFFSGKYESGMVRYNRPHIICFANEPPKEELLSKDRWVIKMLDPQQDAFVVENLDSESDDDDDEPQKVRTIKVKKEEAEAYCKW